LKEICFVKPFEKLTRLGKVRRFRKLAQVALEAYELGETRLKFIHYAGNVLFRVFESNSSPLANDLYHADQYMLRIHEPGYQASESIELELAWLAAMCRDANIAVPQPVPTLDGRLLTQVSIPGIPGAHNCSLLRWIRGRFIPNDIRAHHYRAQGRLMAQIHAHAANWQIPPGLTKRHYDWNGLFRDDAGSGLGASQTWPVLPQRYHAPFQAVGEQARQVMEAWGQGPDVYGLIHADLGVDANVLFWRGEARAIDFDDSGFGYWMYDLAVSLEHCREEAEFPRYREALLGGYAEVRPLPEEQLGRLDLFMAAFYVYLALWAAGAANLYPRHREGLFERMERAAGFAVHYIEGN
jgi:Ser/Thr protein kinase RdoA (MazF antagonist)